MTKPKKPMIRHCYNCEWCLRFMGIDKCDVFYEFIHEPKKKAKRCMYFTMKECESNEEPPKPPTTGSNAIHGIVEIVKGGVADET